MRACVAIGMQLRPPPTLGVHDATIIKGPFPLLTLLLARWPILILFKITL